MEQHVDGGAMAIDGRILVERYDEVATLAGYAHVHVAGGDVGVTGHKALAVAGFRHRNPAKAVQPLREQPRKHFRHMLND